MIGDHPALRHPGRPRACPQDIADEVLRLSRLGHGTRYIASELRRRGKDVSRRSVQRVVNGEGVYERATKKTL